jgi:hypothetical protein
MILKQLSCEVTVFNELELERGQRVDSHKFAKCGVQLSKGLLHFSLQLSFHTTTQHYQKMSFAGRRRGNKVKKGVQFTVMVVGMS